MRAEIDTTVVRDPRPAPLSRALVETAALDVLLDRATARDAVRPSPPAPVQGGTARRVPPQWRRLDSAFIGNSALGTDHTHGVGTTLRASRRDLPEPSVAEDHWARPTSDLAALVAQVRAQLSEVRRDG